MLHQRTQRRLLHRYSSVQTVSVAAINLCSVFSESAGNGSEGEPTKERTMSIGTILLVVLILMLVGVLPVWPHASSWGYGPSGIVGVILVVSIVMFLMGRL